jgi:hypothetical protein
MSLTIEEKKKLKTTIQEISYNMEQEHRNENEMKVPELKKIK